MKACKISRHQTATSSGVTEMGLIRRRRRGRRKGESVIRLLHLIALFANVLALGAVVVSGSTQLVNVTELAATTRQLYKRQSEAVDSQYSATPHQAAFPNGDQDQDQQQQQQHNHHNQQQQNHYEEPLALASSEDTPQDSQQSRQGRGKRTLYACEEKQLEIECQLGESIQLIRANYGRFSIQICNEHGQLDWKVNCMSSDSYDIIARSCQAKQSCQLLASNEIFGDACPGTQKYLEVHYQCVQATANRTQSLGDPQQRPKVNPMKPALIKTGNNVIQQQQQQHQQAAGDNAAATPTSNSESSVQQQQIVTRPPWMGPVTPLSSPKQLPNWIADASLNPYQVTAGRGDAPTTPLTALESSSPSPSIRQQRHCPEMVWRSIRWPETEAGQVAQRHCPAHTFPAGGAAGLAQATLVCQPGGQWAARTHIAGRCHSIWLRNLTQRLDTGDSPLSILSELVYRTQANNQPPNSHHQPQHQQQQQQQQSSGVASWLAYATSSLSPQQLANPGATTTTTTTTAATTAAAMAKLGRFPLFGEDLVQMGRIVGRLVDEMGELLARISDDKQRITFAREMIQLIVELISNLLNEEHADAWLDLAVDGAAATGQSGARQHVAGQLLAGLEGGCVLFAGALHHNHNQNNNQNNNGNGNQEDFQKITDNVYVAIQSFALEPKTANQNQQQQQRLQVVFPSQSNVFGTRWIGLDQRFALSLQASAPADQQTGQQFSAPSQQQLKIVGVMLRGLGAHMQPAGGDNPSSAGDSFQSSWPRLGLAVNSDLVGFSIVADSARSFGKVDLSAPIELVFRHTSQAPPTMTTAALKPAVCAAWDATTSDWSANGCKLVATNRTHSVCACDHLTTFGLLAEPDQQQQQQQQASTSATAATTTSGPASEQHRRLGRVHLDGVEGELSFDGAGSIYMARLLDGALFTSNQQQQTGARSALYASCCLSGLLLALLLAAGAHSRAHTRRLLSSLPTEAPPSLLVANYHRQQLGGSADRMSMATNHGLLHQAGSVETSTTNGASPPTSYSSSTGGGGGPVGAASVDLLAQSASLKQEPASILNHDDQLNGFYSLINQSQIGQYATGGQLKPPYSQLAGSQRHLAAAAKQEPASGGTTFSAQLSLVPVHLIVQLLLLQVLLLVLIESQSLLAWNAQQARRGLMQNTLALLALNQFGGLSEQQQQQQQQPQPQPSDQTLEPIGSVTWLVLFALYYLASSLLCWLLARLVQLNGHLMNQNETLSTIAGKQQQQHHHHQQAVHSISSGAIYTQQQQPQPQHNRYGQCNQILQQGPHLASSSSPSLSNFSSLLVSSDMAVQNRQPPGNHHHHRLDHLESRPAVKGAQVYSARGLYDEPAAGSRRRFARAATSDRLAGLLTHGGPLLTGGLLVWLTYDRAALINLCAYTSAWSSQLAYWPLALNAGWTLPLALLLYCLPSICLALGVLALVMLRRQLSGIYALSALKRPTSDHLESVKEQQQQQQNRLVQGNQQQPPTSMELAANSKRAKFACLTLLALLALNSICWISFFIHCHQALSASLTPIELPPPTSISGNTNNGQQQQQQQQASAHLILAFAVSNLLISLLICCAQRKQLRRACQLWGLSRFFALAGGQCCQLAAGGEATKSSPASTSSVSSSSYYNNNNSHHHHPLQRHDLHPGHQHQPSHYGTGKSIKISSAVSQQSLFAISRSRPIIGTGNALAEIAQPTYDAALGHHHQQQAYGARSQFHNSHPQHYPMLASHHQQHLYQQLASQQHIYDSTSNLSGAAQEFEQQQQQQQKQRQLDALHLMQQQRQQFNQQEPMIHYTLGRPFSGSHQFNQQHQQQQQQLCGNMTLKPMPSTGQAQFAPLHRDQPGACPINGAAKTQHHLASQQQVSNSSSSNASSSGEADGPLVALAQITTPTTLTSSSSSSSDNNNNNNDRRREFSIAVANQTSTTAASPATFGPTTAPAPAAATTTTSPAATTASHYNLIANGHQHSHSLSSSSNCQPATEYRPSSNTVVDNQSFVGVGGGGGGHGVGNHYGASNQSGASAGKPIKHNNCTQQQQRRHLAASAKQQAAGQNYTDALKAAMAQEANQQQQQHFRRTNSATRRLQQQQQPHRSFASPSTNQFGDALMIDAQLNHHQQQQQQTTRPARFAPTTDAENNIYDVANCAPPAAR